MTIGQILFAIITGLAINECCDVAPWLARKLVRWSARRRYAPPSRAELRAEELAAYIDDCPGKLFKLFTALIFAIKAVAIRRKVALAVAPPNPLWWPTAPAISINYQNEDSSPDPHAYAVRQAWRQLADEVRDAARKLGVGSRSWRRCIKELWRITGDERWAQVERNLDLLEKINRSRVEVRRVELHLIAPPELPPVIIKHYYVLKGSTVAHYQSAVGTVRVEIRRLINDFLLSSVPR